MKKNSLARILVASAMLTLSVAATSFAAVGDKEVDLNIGFATEPTSGLGTGYALTVGGGLELMDVSAIKGSTLQVRGDFGYGSWSKDPVTLTRMPISAGARLYVPLEAVQNLRVYGEASLELSIDSAEVDLGAFGLGKSTSDETNFGLSPAAGVEFAVTPNINILAGIKYHIIDSGYLTGSVGIGYKF